MSTLDVYLNAGHLVQGEVYWWAYNEMGPVVRLRSREEGRAWFAAYMAGVVVFRDVEWHVVYEKLIPHLSSTQRKKETIPALLAMLDWSRATAPVLKRRRAVEKARQELREKEEAKRREIKAKRQAAYQKGLAAQRKRLPLERKLTARLAKERADRQRHGEQIVVAEKPWWGESPFESLCDRFSGLYGRRVPPCPSLAVQEAAQQPVLDAPSNGWIDDDVGDEALLDAWNDSGVNWMFGRIALPENT